MLINFLKEIDELTSALQRASAVTEEVKAEIESTQAPEVHDISVVQEVPEITEVHEARESS